MMPPYSWSTPGRKPGISTNVTSGILKALQKRTNPAPLSDASISRAPASTFGWLATIQTVAPRMRQELNLGRAPNAPPPPPFARGVVLRRARQHLRLVGHNTDRGPANAPEAH